MSNKIYGARGEVVNAHDCGSCIRGFDSPRAPHLKYSIKQSLIEYFFLC